MAILGEIRKRSWLVVAVIALGLLAFLVDPESISKLFGKDPLVLGKVNGEKITRQEYDSQLSLLQEQAKSQGKPTTGLEQQVWDFLVQGKLIKQQFEKLGFSITDDIFWNQLQYDQMFSQNPEFFDPKGNFLVAKAKKEVEKTMAENPQFRDYWTIARPGMEYKMMARILFTHLAQGVNTNKKEAEQLMKFRDQIANIEYVKIDYAAYLAKNPIKVSTSDLNAYVKKHPLRFKSKPSRNLGIVYFNAEPSAEDQAKYLSEINNLIQNPSAENFTNTKSDSLFISANSDEAFSNAYISRANLPEELKSKVDALPIGQIYGPFKFQNYFAATKILDKKPSDSILSKHILISWEGLQTADPGLKRTKEQAKKQADSIAAIIKANPARFNEFLSLSADKGSATQGGNIGWTTPETGLAKGYKTFISTQPKGAIGVAETEFGYHIISVDDKKSGEMTYKLANLVKRIAPSDKTENETFSKATRFIQQVQGKTFNDFSKAATAAGVKVLNPKSLTRFEAAIPGLGTDADGRVLAWAFGKDRKKGDVEMLEVPGSGSRIVAYINGINNSEIMDPESIREQIEPIVKNELAAKKIISSLGNATNLQAAAAKFAVPVATATINVLNPSIAGGYEPKVAGAAFGITAGKVSKPIEGQTGVYLIQNKGVITNKQPGSLEDIIKSNNEQMGQVFTRSLMKSLEDNAKIEDYRTELLTGE